MKLPKPEDLNAYVDTLFSDDYTKALRSIATPINPLRDCTPATWAVPTHEGTEL